MQVRVVARERHREIETKPEVCRFRRLRRGELLAAFHDLEDQLLVLAPLRAHEDFEVLDGRGLDPRESVRCVDIEDPRAYPITRGDLPREQVAHALCRGGARRRVFHE